MKAIVDARNAGARVVFDTNLRPALWSSPEIMASTLTAAATISDIVLPTHPDEAPLFNDTTANATATRYLDLGVEEVAVKNGSEPAVIGMAEERVTVAATKGEVVDATGAGDSFNGGYLSARIAGASLKEAAEAAHRVAGVVIGHPGALVDPALVRDQGWRSSSS
jgi:2-dehydro-3-deoxygluconokinase